MNKKGYGTWLASICIIGFCVLIIVMIVYESYYDFKVRPKCLELENCEQYKCLADNAHSHNDIQTNELRYQSCMMGSNSNNV